MGFTVLGQEFEICAQISRIFLILFFKFTESLKVDGHYAECLAEDDLSEHFQLRDGSPMTLVINNNRRHGMHLGLGNIIFSLITLGKFTVREKLFIVSIEIYGKLTSANSEGTGDLTH